MAYGEEFTVIISLGLFFKRYSHNIRPIPISKQLTQGVAGLLKQNKVARVDGEASFIGPKTLSVKKSDGSVEEMTADTCRSGGQTLKDQRACLRYRKGEITFPRYDAAGCFRVRIRG